MSQMHPTYELLYWPEIPGRGEFIRLVFESAHVPYKDISNECQDGIQSVLEVISTEATGEDGNPPAFAPPALRIVGEGKDGKNLIIYQTPSILMYLGGKLGLLGTDEADKFWIISHTLTGLDLNNETHDTHHPLSVSEYYEAQKDEALKKAKDFRENRIPKFLGFFERVLKGNIAQGQGRYLVGNSLSIADTTVWHVLSGLQHAFPRELQVRRKEYPTLFETFYTGIQEQDGLKGYLSSERRKPFSNGVYRHYPELDRQ
ncbi:hypothetical protein ACN47E_003781 [Coniothyrium glycines]